jgi:predicted O-linked N-acetylglucosamine transferase (SPINDLY family)
MLRRLLSRLSRRAAERLVAEGTRAEAEGRFTDACERYQQALKILPGHAPAYLNLGIALEGAGDARSAREAYLSTLEVDPGNPYAHFNLGKLLHAAGNHPEATRQLRSALERKPDFVDARIVLASALEAQGDAEGATAMLREALEQRPDYAGAWYNYALLLQKVDRMPEAEAAMRRALGFWPERADLWLRQGELLKSLQRLPESEAALRRALALEPRLSGGYRLLASILGDQQRPEEALQVLAAGREFDSDGYTRACELFTLNFHEGISSEALFERHKAFGAELENLHPARFAPFTNSRDPERKLRVGFISGDFRAHPIGWSFLPLIERLDRSRHEVYCYSVFGAGDDVTRRIAARAKVWHDVSPLSARETADFINKDRIDILMDLSGYGGIAPMEILASRPAPVQASWLGYLSTSGMTRVDYRITDVHADPPELADRFHTEKLLRLPHSQWCYRPPAASEQAAEPPPTPPCERNGFVTFGSFNQAAKLSPTARRLWAEILKRLPRSRLLVVGMPPGPATQALLDEFERNGVARGAVSVEPRLLLADYFRKLREVDLLLDTMPYSGGTTTCDALWMGAPIITLPGSRSVSRSAASILSVLGLSAWIAASPEDYVARAVELASDPARIARARKGLRERMRASPLMDEARFARDMEALYRQMWREWCTSSR